MADSSNGAQPDRTEADGAPPLIVNAQYLKDLSFENPNAPQSLLAAQDGPPQVEVSVSVGGNNLAPNVYEVVLSITATAKQGEQTAFVIEVAYGGVFTINGIPDEHVKPVLMIEGPRLLFPFARSVIADGTREGGFPPLMLQPIDFVTLYRREQGELTARA